MTVASRAGEAPLVMRVIHHLARLKHVATMQRLGPRGECPFWEGYRAAEVSHYENVVAALE